MVCRRDVALRRDAQALLLHAAQAALQKGGVAGGRKGLQSFVESPRHRIRFP